MMGFPKGVGLPEKLHVLFPAFPDSMGENRCLLRYQECLITWADSLTIVEV